MCPSSPSPLATAITQTSVASLPIRSALDTPMVVPTLARVTLVAPSLGMVSSAELCPGAMAVPTPITLESTPKFLPTAAGSPVLLASKALWIF